MKYLEVTPIQLAKSKNLAALKQYAGGALHGSSTCRQLVYMEIDEENDRAELHIYDGYEQYFSQSDRNAMTDTQSIPPIGLEQLQA